MGIGREPRTFYMPTRLLSGAVLLPHGMRYNWIASLASRVGQGARLCASRSHPSARGRRGIGVLSSAPSGEPAMRKCFLCGQLYYDGESICPSCQVSLTWMDRFRLWRRVRRFLLPRAPVVMLPSGWQLLVVLLVIVVLATGVGLMSPSFGGFGGSGGLGGFRR